MLFTYHNHTNWSDGGATLAAMIQAARELGVDELGISDHYVLHPEGDQEWSMPAELLGDYFSTLRQASAEVKGIVLRTGLEADYIPETAAELRAELELFDWDYVIGSVHFVDGFCVDEKAEDWRRLTPERRDQVWIRYWELVAELARTEIFDILAHPDLPKKFGFRPAADLRELEEAALDAVAAAGMAIEINTAGWSLPAAEGYPSLRILRAARERDIPLTISADAHFPEFILRDFDRAADLARQAGYEALVRFERGLMRAASLPDLAARVA